MTRTAPSSADSGGLTDWSTDVSWAREAHSHRSIGRRLARYGTDGKGGEAGQPKAVGAPVPASEKGQAPQLPGGSEMSRREIQRLENARGFREGALSSRSVTKPEKTLRNTLSKPPLHWYIPPAPHGRPGHRGQAFSGSFGRIDRRAAGVSQDRFHL